MVTHQVHTPNMTVYPNLPSSPSSSASPSPSSASSSSHCLHPTVAVTAAVAAALPAAASPSPPHSHSHSHSHSPPSHSPNTMQPTQHTHMPQRKNAICRNDEQGGNAAVSRNAASFSSSSSSRLAHLTPAPIIVTSHHVSRSPLSTRLEPLSPVVARLRSVTQLTPLAGRTASTHSHSHSHSHADTPTHPLTPTGPHTPTSRNTHQAHRDSYSSAGSSASIFSSRQGSVTLPPISASSHPLTSATALEHRHASFDMDGETVDSHVNIRPCPSPTATATHHPTGTAATQWATIDALCHTFSQSLSSSATPPPIVARRIFSRAFDADPPAAPVWMSSASFQPVGDDASDDDDDGAPDLRSPRPAHPTKLSTGTPQPQIACASNANVIAQEYGLVHVSRTASPILPSRSPVPMPSHSPQLRPRSPRSPLPTIERASPTPILAHSHARATTGHMYQLGFGQGDLPYDSPISSRPSSPRGAHRKANSARRLTTAFDLDAAANAVAAACITEPRCKHHTPPPSASTIGVAPITMQPRSPFAASGRAITCTSPVARTSDELTTLSYRVSNSIPTTPEPRYRPRSNIIPYTPQSCMAI